MKITAFVSHSDCARHDTGWGHPDHQGRLPGLMRAVYADMLTLFEPLLEVEGRHATERELGLVHSPEYLHRVRRWVTDAAESGVVIEPVEGIRLSGASWDAATAAVGSTLTAVDIVASGDVMNAFCPVRPAGRYVRPEEPAEFGLLNTVATPARYVMERDSGARVLVIEIGGRAGSPTADLLEGSPALVLGVYREQGPDSSRDRPRDRPGEGAQSGSGGERFLAAVERLLLVAADFKPTFIILSLGFDGMAGDPLGDMDLTAIDYYHATRRIRDFAVANAGGRIVSILEGGYDAAGLGAATVQHLRALADAGPAE